ncbi:PAS domain-containing sensor histidine kinase [Seonamhaeicola aphaedonensis]|uniref:histidine kinase n=1 Tax=Seonamhaeicola aphaedonensis TaxID=1461338 RepID=A0A3D9HJB3_9FLAO|nr:PAS domain-containing sensor histidine kinase [Seonamhaeicola aphaedonensis]RED49371.1 PAS domain S-box-containing protein [Seonamhaeicola aphaedonensis]
MFNQDQEIFNILLEAVFEGVIIVDNQQKIMEVNLAAENIFGYSKNELIDKKLSLLLPADYRKKHTTFFNIFLKRGTRRKMGETKNIYGLKKDGAIFPMDIELNPFSIYNKTYVMALIRDISERKKIEESLMLRTKALQSARNGIIITDALKDDNPVVFFNSAFQDLTGYSNTEILNHNCRFLQGKDRDQAPLKKLREAIKKGESCQATLRNYKKDGTMFWNDLYVFPITNTKGIVTNFIGIQNDVTQRKQVEEERHHLATIFDESLNEIYVFDVETLKFINANYGAKKNIGFSLDELQVMTPLEITTKSNVSNLKESINTLLNRNMDKIEFETVHQRKDGSTYPVEVHLQISDLGEKKVFVAIVLDITDRKNYTTKLENEVEIRTQQLEIALSKEKELNELKSKFLSLVSHEFKTPLSGILTSTQLLSKYQLSEHQEKRNKHINIITDKVHFLNNILNDFLSIEKLESGKVNYKYSHFKLSKVVNEVVYDYNMLLKEGQKINYPEDIDDISVYQDEKIIQLIFSNLLHNAIKYSPEESCIDLNIKQHDGFTTLKITDKGIGIPEKDQARIFQRYFRADNVMNTQGTGIGLNIVKNHLENLGGTIKFESEENIGSTFKISFPNNAEQIHMEYNLEGTN